jgi:hypothetical protein
MLISLSHLKLFYVTNTLYDYSYLLCLAGRTETLGVRELIIQNVWAQEARSKGQNFIMRMFMFRTRRDVTITKIHKGEDINLPQLCFHPVTAVGGCFCEDH